MQFSTAEFILQKINDGNGVVGVDLLDLGKIAQHRIAMLRISPPQPMSMLWEKKKMMMMIIILVHIVIGEIFLMDTRKHKCCENCKGEEENKDPIILTPYRT